MVVNIRLLLHVSNDIDSARMWQSFADNKEGIVFFVRA